MAKFQGVFLLAWFLLSWDIGASTSYSYLTVVSLPSTYLLQVVIYVWFFMCGWYSTKHSFCLIKYIFFRNFWLGPKDFDRWAPQVTFKVLLMCVLVFFLRRGSMVIRKVLKQIVFSLLRECFWVLVASWPLYRELSNNRVSLLVFCHCGCQYLVFVFFFHVLNKLSLCMSICPSSGHGVRHLF